VNHRHLLPNEIDLLVDGEAGFGVAPLRAHVAECDDCPALVRHLRSVIEGRFVHRRYSGSTFNGRAGTGHLKRASQPEHAFTRPDLSESRVAGRQHGPFDSVQVQACDLFRRQNPIVLVELRGAAAIRAGEGQPGEEQRVLAAFFRKSRRH